VSYGSSYLLSLVNRDTVFSEAVYFGRICNSRLGRLSTGGEGSGDSGSSRVVHRSMGGHNESFWTFLHHDEFNRCNCRLCHPAVNGLSFVCHSLGSASYRRGYNALSARVLYRSLCRGLWGLGVGGPILRNKLFFCGSFGRIST
jgi:hypothetical protein